MLEAVLASVLLTLAAIAASTTVSFLARCQVDDQRRLGGYELASRKILEYLDDSDSIGSDAVPQVMYGFRYRWRLEKDSLRMDVKQSEAAARSAAQLRADRFEVITVTVWAVDEAEAARTGVPVAGEQVARLTRVSDPIAAMMFRNPDSRDFNITNRDALARLMASLGGAAPAPKGKDARPAPPAPPPPGKAPAR
jgi:hypothetical protein